MSVLLDAGPCLNFLAVSQQNILIQAAAAADLQIMAPERVDHEVADLARLDNRFARTGAGKTWATLKASGRVQVLSDTLATQELTDAVTRISGKPAADRMRQRKSLGEIMVLAHASVFAQAGQDVFVLIDESDGRLRAEEERRWLRRAASPGRLEMWSTVQLLRAAGREQGWIAGDLTWEQVYDKMRRFDDGLPPRESLGAKHSIR